jgi:amidase
MAANNEKTDWAALIAEKRLSNLAKIPEKWHLQQSLLENLNENAQVGVLDIPRKCGILTEEELAITEQYTAVELIDAMTAGRLGSEAVVTAFCKRAAIAHQLVRNLPLNKRFQKIDSVPI